MIEWQLEYQATDSLLHLSWDLHFMEEFIALVRHLLPRDLTEEVRVAHHDSTPQDHLLVLHLGLRRGLDLR